jgi:hypothetical protein
MTTQTALMPDQDQVENLTLDLEGEAEIGPITSQFKSVPIRIKTNADGIVFKYGAAAAIDATDGVELGQGIEVFDIPSGSYVGFKGQEGQTLQVTVLKSQD